MSLDETHLMATVYNSMDGQEINRQQHGIIS